ncbi:hypothetical protein V6N13_094514 [Hibiscus sabdariffa]
MTNEGRSRRQFTTDVSCSISGVALESLDHVFLLVLSGISAYNAKVFDAPRVEESSVINRNARLVSMMVQAREECQLVRPLVDVMPRGLPHWEPPPPSCIKLNIVGAWCEIDGYAHCGGVACDTNGT